MSVSPRRSRLGVHPLEDRTTPASGDVIFSVTEPALSDVTIPTNNTAAEDGFGAAIALADGWLVVGTPGADPAGIPDVGRAYVFNASTGALVAVLNPPTPTAGDRFGSAVAVSGNRVIVGAPSENPGGITDAGRAYVFDAASGTLLQTLVSPTPNVGDNFGTAVAIAGTLAVVGASFDELPAAGGVADAGRAHVFDAGSGALVSTLNHPDPHTYDAFGAAVSISGGQVVVGAPGFDIPLGGNVGRAYTFEASTGAVLATLANPVPSGTPFVAPTSITGGSRFGRSLGVSGDRVVIGTESGRAYLFHPTTGAQVAELVNPALGPDRYGYSVAIAGPRVVVGSPGNETDGFLAFGRAHVFDTSGTLLVTLRNKADAHEDPGWAVAVAGDRAAVAAPRVDPGEPIDASRVDLFDANAPPRAGNDTLTVAEDSGPTALAVLANDTTAPDTGETLTITAVSPGAHGFTAIVAGGTQVTYIPAANYFGPDSFTYTVTDGKGNFATATVSVTVTPVNDPPTATADNVAVRPGRTTVLDVLQNDSILPDSGETLTILAVTQGAQGSVAITAGGTRVTYTPNPGFLGTDSFTYTVGDGSGQTATATVSVTVTPTAAPPPPPPGPTGPVSIPFLVGGLPNGQVTPLAPSGSNLALGGPITLFADAAVEVRATAADVTGDGVPDFIGGAGPGGGPRVVILDGKSGGVVADFFAFDPSFVGGVFVAAADVDGDGQAEVIVTPDRGGGPVVALYSGAKLSAGHTGDAAQIVRFLGINDPAFRGGVRPAIGDLNGDGTPEIIIAAGFGGGPRVAVFDGNRLLTESGLADQTPARWEGWKLVGDFFAFEPDLRDGVFVAAGDVDADGKADLVFGAGPGGAPRVRGVSGPRLVAAAPPSLDDPKAAGVQLLNFFAGGTEQRGGVSLALRDSDGDRQVELVTASGQGEPGRLRVYRSGNLRANPAPSPDQDLDVFGGVTLTNGVYVG